MASAPSSDRDPIVSPEALDAIARYSWPGNVRELENCLRRAAVLATSGVIRPEHLGLVPAIQTSPTELRSLAELEREHVSRVLAATGGHKARTAQILGVVEAAVESFAARVRARMIARTMSLRTRLVLIAFIAAILPLGLVGAWLANSSSRSAEELLRARLEDSLHRVATGIGARWVARRADLLTIAEGDAVHGGSQPAAYSPNTKCVSRRGNGSPPRANGRCERLNEWLKDHSSF